MHIQNCINNNNAQEWQDIINSNNIRALSNFIFDLTTLCVSSSTIIRMYQNNVEKKL